jgi:hypothetical protein
VQTAGHELGTLRGVVRWMAGVSASLVAGGILLMLR